MLPLTYQGLEEQEPSHNAAESKPPVQTEIIPIIIIKADPEKKTVPMHCVIHVHVNAPFIV